MNTRTPDPSLIGTKVRVYRNLNQRCWSIQVKGKVVGHASTLELKNIHFKVLRSGYERYQREQRKNVHAFVCGELVALNGTFWTIGGTQVTYSPKQRTPLFRTVQEDVFKGREFYFDESQIIKRAFFTEHSLWVSNREEAP